MFDKRFSLCAHTDTHAHCCYLLSLSLVCCTQLIGNVKQFFLAGTDTVGGVMSWLMYELAVHQAVQDKLRAEILSVITQGDTPTLLHIVLYIALSTP
jgi:Cytochrome P450